MVYDFITNWLNTEIQKRYICSLTNFIDSQFDWFRIYTAINDKLAGHLCISCKIKFHLTFDSRIYRFSIAFKNKLRKKKKNCLVKCQNTNITLDQFDSTNNWSRCRHFKNKVCYWVTQHWNYFYRQINSIEEIPLYGSVR